MAFQADVLNLGVGERAFVLNKQAPNLQLWLSSPVRGPLRYDFDSASARWINNRDAHPMLPALASDIRYAPVYLRSDPFTSRKVTILRSFCLTLS
mgnify:CR=1 FL=1